jgi:predicted sugar kinase
MRWIGEHHPAAVGQSSWGPTAFAILPSEAQAREVLAQARTSAAMAPGLVATIVAGRNQGARVIRGAAAFPPVLAAPGGAADH